MAASSRSLPTSVPLYPMRVAFSVSEKFYKIWFRVASPEPASNETFMKELSARDVACLSFFEQVANLIMNLNECRQGPLSKDF